jgi:tRNA threonylcarbamoyl adenosine modification protein YeaZ
VDGAAPASALEIGGLPPVATVGWLLVFVLVLDTSTPSVTAGVVRLREPNEIIAGLAAAGRPETGSTPAGPSPRVVELLAERSVTNAFAHAERLMPLTLAALAAAGLQLGDLRAVVVGVGPGPFTGLRVGIATAAALGDGLDIPVHGLPSHDGVARALAPLPGDLLVVTDARRREVYLSGYRATGGRAIGPVVVRPAAVPDLLVENSFSAAYLTGSGAILLEPQRSAAFDPAPLDSGAAPITVGLAERAARALLTGAIPGPLSPLYLRRPDATEPGARKSVLGR